MVQWLKLCTLNAGGPGSIPGQGTRSHMSELRVCRLQLKISSAITKTQHGQKKKIYVYIHIHIHIYIYFKGRIGILLKRGEKFPTLPA